MLPQTNLSFYTVDFLGPWFVRCRDRGGPALWGCMGRWVVKHRFGGDYCCQLFELANIGGARLLVLSAIDLAVILLTLIEWQQKRQMPRGGV